MVLTDHRTLDASVLANPRLKAVSFTGSTSVGLDLQRRLAGTNVRLQTEMGGKNAAVVMADADLDRSIIAIVTSAFGQAGQRCTATSRVIVERSAYAEVIGRLTMAAGRIRVGPATASDSTMGPVVNEGRRSEILMMVRDAVRAGGTLLSGGDALSQPPLDGGCFVGPTIIADVSADSRIWREEVFGPVIAIMPCGSLDEALTLVNDSAFGLSAAVYTSSLRSAHRFVELADVGQVAVNLPTVGWDVHMPFGGFKASGSAFKEGGLDALRFYTRTKTAALSFD